MRSHVKDFSSHSAMAITPTIPAKPARPIPRPEVGMAAPAVEDEDVARLVAFEAEFVPLSVGFVPFDAGFVAVSRLVTVAVASPAESVRVVIWILNSWTIDDTI